MNFKCFSNLYHFDPNIVDVRFFVFTYVMLSVNAQLETFDDTKWVIGRCKSITDSRYK